MPLFHVHVNKTLPLFGTKTDREVLTKAPFRRRVMISAMVPLVRVLKISFFSSRLIPGESFCDQDLSTNACWDSVAGWFLHLAERCSLYLFAIHRYRLVFRQEWNDLR